MNYLVMETHPAYAVLLDEEGVTVKGGKVALKGDIRINGQELEAYIQDIVYQVLSSILG